MNVESENKYKDLKKESLGISLAAQWLRTSPSDAGGVGSIPGRGGGIPHALWPKDQGMERRQYCNKFSGDFKNGPH